MGPTALGRRCGFGLVALALVLSLAACGGDFEYQIGGDRTQSDTRASVATDIEQGGAPPSHEQLLQLQADYAKKLEAANAAKGGG